MDDIAGRYAALRLARADTGGLDLGQSRNASPGSLPGLARRPAGVWRRPI